MGLRMTTKILHSHKVNKIYGNFTDVLESDETLPLYTVSPPYTMTTPKRLFRLKSPTWKTKHNRRHHDLCEFVTINNLSWNSIETQVIQHEFVAIHRIWPDFCSSPWKAKTFTTICIQWLLICQIMCEIMHLLPLLQSKACNFQPVLVPEILRDCSYFFRFEWYKRQEWEGIPACADNKGCSVVI